MEKSNLTELSKSFNITIAENYERYMAPLYFEPSAVELAARIPGKTSSLLEIACGTGQVTRLLRQRLPAADIIATDLNPGMIEIAKRIIGQDVRLNFQSADAQELQFEDNRFDAVICQFGVMFFPERQKAVNEAYRVLKPGGKYFFTTWKKYDIISKMANDIIMQQFSDDPPDFYSIPFSMVDPKEHKQLLLNAGFRNVDVHGVSKKGTSESPENAAMALTEGTPAYVMMSQRDEKLVPAVQKKLVDELKKIVGSSAFSIEIELWVAEGEK
jgi:ubiquinone/menaquinone biosynthesis C-methylase UbiE